MPSLRTMFAAWLTLLLAVSLAIGGNVRPARADTAQPKPDIPLVGHLPSYGNGTKVIVDEGAHHLIELNGGASTAVASIYDANLQKIADKSFDFFVSNINYYQTTYSWDEASRRLYLVGYPTSTDMSAETNPMLVVMDGSLNVISKKPMPAFPSGVFLTGMSYYAPANRLYLVGQVCDPGCLFGYSNVQVAEVDPTTAMPTWPQPYTVPSCQKSIGDMQQAAIVRSSVEPTVFIGCGTGNLIVSSQPGVPGVAAIDISKPGSITSRIYPMSGVYAGGESLFDPQARRFIMVASTPGSAVQSARVFDMDHRVYLGKIGGGNINIHGVAVDAVGGRMYVVLDNQLRITSDRGLEIPEANNYQLLNTGQGGAWPVRFNHTLLVNGEVNDHFDVYRNPATDYVAPLSQDPDSLTNGGPERPGSTDVNFSASGKAFGVRVLQVAGIDGTLQNVMATPNDYWKILGKPGGINDGDRDFYFARVNRAFLSQSEASALAISTDGNENNRADWETATKPPNTTNPQSPSDQPGQPWPSTPASCVDNGTGTAPNTQDNSTTTCDQQHAKTVASSLHANVPALTDATDTVFSTGSATSNVTITRDPKLGAVSTVTSEVKDVNLGGIVHIGHVWSQAKAQAKGARGTTLASYDRKFEDVSIGGSVVCGSSCDPQAVTDQINQALGPKFVVELPAFQTTASPGGATASALRDPWQHQQDVVTNDQEGTELQTAGLRVTYVNDNAATSRLVLEFAGSQADAVYNIYTVDGGSSVGSDDSVAPPAPESTATLNAPSGAADTTAAESGAITSAPTEKPSASDGGNPVQKLLRRLGHGLRLLLTGRHHTLLNLLLWILLATPIFLATRRRYLLQLIGEYRS